MDLKQIIRGAVRDSLEKSGQLSSKKINKDLLSEKNKATASKVSLAEAVKRARGVIKEALVAMPQSFSLNTEKLSDITKRTHQQLYSTYVDVFNKTSAALDGADVHQSNRYSSSFRSLKLDEAYNLNAIKLHELYFHNISDQASEISVDALPYMRLARDFGTFENWQFDFMACCKASRNGWAVLVHEPYKNVYMNVVIDSHDAGLPMGAVPILVMDMFEHAYMVDYETAQDDYIVAMMREVNWNVVEARMALVEQAELTALYMIRPVYNAVPQEMLDSASTAPPIDQVTADGDVEAPPTTPPGPDQAPSPYETREQ